MNLEEKRNQGIAAIQTGQPKKGQALLREVVKADETQLEAWLWLSRVVESLDEKQICLENVLTLDPANTEAQLTLAQVALQQESLLTPTYKAGEEEPPPPVITHGDNATTPITRDYPHKDEFDNELLCPFCAKQTQTTDRACPHCKNNLIVSLRLRDEPSAWLWRGIFLQVGIILSLVSVWSVSFILGLRYMGIVTPTAYLPLYFGQSVTQPEQQLNLVLASYPRWLFWGFAAAVLYSAILMAMLYFRVKHGNTVYMVSACLLLSVGLSGMVLFYQNFLLFWGAAACFVVGIAQMLVSFNLWSDFQFQEGRIFLKVDRGAKNHATLYLSGRKYADLGMWGLAIIHLRRAIGRDSYKPVYHMLLTLAYLQIQRPDLAEKSLKEAEKLDPNAAEVRQLRKRLEQQKVRD